MNYYKSVLRAGAKAKSVTTASAEALAEAEQLTHIVRVMCYPYYLNLLFFH
jgi:flavin-binding protein dodecin